MKIIVTEEQYNKIEHHVNEVKQNVYDKKIQKLLGQKILDLYDNIGEGNVIEITLKSGNKVVLKCISDKNNVYVFSIVDDAAKIFKKWDNVSITINPGNGEDDESINEYKLNQKVITTSDNGVSFDLIFVGSKKNGLKNSIKMNKVEGFKTLGNNDEPENPNVASEPEDKKLKKVGEKTLDYMLKDKNLQSAFYEQPSLWQLFIAELTGKKAKGKGIITVNNLVKRYDDKKISNDLKAKFVKDKTIWFIPMDTINLKKNVGREVIQVEMNRNNKDGYKTIVLEKQLAEGPKMRGEIEGITYTLEILSKLREENFGYMCHVTIINDNNTESKPIKKRVIILHNNKSNGFEPTQNNTE